MTEMIDPAFEEMDGVLDAEVATFVLGILFVLLAVVGALAVIGAWTVWGWVA